MILCNLKSREHAPHKVRSLVKKALRLQSVEYYLQIFPATKIRTLYALFFMSADNNFIGGSKAATMQANQWQLAKSSLRLSWSGVLSG